MSSSTTSERRRYTSDGIELLADEFAATPSRGVAMLLHGGGQTRYSWQRAAQRLAEAGWSALTLDARGHGESGWAADANYSQDALVADLKTVVGTLDESPVLIGASMGGLTSLVAVGEGAVKARALILVDIAPRIEEAGASKIGDFMRARPEGFDNLEEVAAAVAAYNPHRKRPGSLEGLKKNVRLGDDGKWHWHWDPAFMRPTEDEPRRMVAEDRLVRAAKNVTVPTLLVRGKQSDVVSVEGAKELLELVPGSRYVDVSGAGHMVAGDDNDIFTQQVLTFLSELPA